MSAVSKDNLNKICKDAKALMVKAGYPEAQAEKAAVAKMIEIMENASEKRIKKLSAESLQKLDTFEKLESAVGMQLISDYLDDMMDAVKRELKGKQ